MEDDGQEKTNPKSTVGNTEVPPWVRESRSFPSRGRRRYRMPKNDIIQPGYFLRVGSLSKETQRHLGTGDPYDFTRWRTSNSPPAAHVERRTKSLADLGRKDIKSLYSDCGAREVRNPKRPLPQDERNERRAESGSLCSRCIDMNIERLTADGGYDHSMLGDMLESRRDCRLCNLLLSEISRVDSWTPDRYRIVISLGKEDAIHDTDHYNVGRDGISSATYFSFLSAAVVDLRPWERPEYHKIIHIYRELLEGCAEPENLPPVAVRVRTPQIFTEMNDPATAFGLKWVRDIGNNTASDSSFDIAAGWFTKCISEEHSPPKNFWHHKTEEEDSETQTRSAPIPPEKPVRLVEINPSLMGDGMIRLVETKECDCPYAALSYCWGKAGPGNDRSYQTTTANVNQRFKRFNRNSLPATIQDSISIAERLGIPYIWIDALCIIQDSGEDWAREAAKMAGIYLGCELAIAVSGSASAEQGCFNEQSHPTIHEQGFGDNWVVLDGTLEDGRRSRLFIGRYLHGYFDKTYENEILNGPLAKRAWTFQEHILPRRTLYYSSKQLYWECTHCRLSEDNYPQTQGRRSYPIADCAYELDLETTTRLWYTEVIEQYSRRKMTFGRDKLVALTALAKATYLNRKMDYIAGIWKESLITGLLWCRDGDGHKSRIYNCPSWSWASQDSPVSFSLSSYVNDDELPLNPKILDVQWKIADPGNPFADVESAYIDIETWIGIGTALRDNFMKWEPYGEEWKHSQAFFISGLSSHDLWSGRCYLDDGGVAGGRFAFALLWMTRDDTQRAYLLLDPPKLDAGVYRRVGLAIIQTHHVDHQYAGDMLKVCERRNIRLV